MSNKTIHIVPTIDLNFRIVRDMPVNYKRPRVVVRKYGNIIRDELLIHVKAKAQEDFGDLT